MKLLRENLLFQFSMTSLVIMVVLGVLLSWGISRSIREHVLAEAIDDAVDLLGGRIERRLTPQDLLVPMTGERYAAFQSWVDENVVSQRIARIKIWDREGRVIYSNDSSQVGQIYPIKPNLKQALDGENAAEIMVPTQAENARERFLGILIEVYAPIILPNSKEITGAFEIYQYYAPFAEVIANIQRTVYIFVGAGLALLYFSLFFIVKRGWDTISGQRHDLQRQLREINGLNNLMRTHLDNSRGIIDGLRDLDRQLEARPSGSDAAALLSAYLDLSAKVKRLAAEAESHP